MLRLEESRESHLLRVSGRIDAESLAELRMQMQIHSSPIACFLLHCRRSLSRHWGRNVEVPALGLVCVFGNCFASAGDHVAGANAGFERVVHRLRHWGGSDLRWGLADRPCHSDPQPARRGTRKSCLTLNPTSYSLNASILKGACHGKNASGSF